MTNIECIRQALKVVGASFNSYPCFVTRQNHMCSYTFNSNRPSNHLANMIRDELRNYFGDKLLDCYFIIKKNLQDSVFVIKVTAV